MPKEHSIQVVNIDPDSFLQTMVHSDDLIERTAAHFAFVELLGLIRVTPRDKNARVVAQVETDLSAVELYVKEGLDR